MTGQKIITGLCEAIARERSIASLMGTKMGALKIDRDAKDEQLEVSLEEVNRLFYGDGAQDPLGRSYVLDAAEARAYADSGYMSPNDYYQRYAHKPPQPRRPSRLSVRLAIVGVALYAVVIVGVAAWLTWMLV